ATIAPLTGAMFMDVEVSRLLIGIYAVIGHTYPIFAKFKGGKAVATSGGVILGINPLLFLAIVATFLITLKITKYVSLSSMLTGVIATIISAFLHDLLLFCMILFLKIFFIICHLEIINCIKNKIDNKIT